MKSLNAFTRCLIPALSILLFAGTHWSAASAASEKKPEIRVAVTVDDLPTVGDIPSSTTRHELLLKFISDFQQAKVEHVVGFANGEALEFHPDLHDAMDKWVEAGFSLGNHTYGHHGLKKLGIDDFFKDLQREEPLLTRWAGDKWLRIVRFPYMEDGRLLGNHQQVMARLEEIGYANAPVTFDFSDWAWNGAWVRCSESKYEDGLAFLRNTYVNAARYSLHTSITTSRHAHGRVIDLILVLHANAITATVLPDLLTMLEQEGVTYISLDEALQDPVYDPSKSKNPAGIQSQWLDDMHTFGRPASFTIPRIQLATLCK